MSTSHLISQSALNYMKFVPSSFSLVPTKVAARTIPLEQQKFVDQINAVIETAQSCMYFEDCILVVFGKYHDLINLQHSNFFCSIQTACLSIQPNKFNNLFDHYLQAYVQHIDRSFLNRLHYVSKILNVFFYLEFINTATQYVGKFSVKAGNKVEVSSFYEDTNKLVEFVNQHELQFVLADQVQPQIYTTNNTNIGDNEDQNNVDSIYDFFDKCQQSNYDYDKMVDQLSNNNFVTPVSSPRLSSCCPPAPPQKTMFDYSQIHDASINQYHSNHWCTQLSFFTPQASFQEQN